MVVSLVSGIIIGILLSYIVWFSRRRCLRNKNPKAETIDLSYNDVKREFVMLHEV